MKSKIESDQIEERSPNHFHASVEAPASSPPPQLAEGTRKDIHIQTAKGLRIATRCETIEKFVATYHPICEDTAIFIPNTRRSIGAITQFTFNLADGQPALVGIGSVTEEFTTNANRFGQVGIVIALQQLARGSKAVFEAMVAARAAARQAHAVDRAPGPLYARTVTGPVMVPDAVKPDARHTEAAKVAIPNPTPHRSKTVMGLPVISKSPAVAAFKVPAIIAPPIKKPDKKVRAPAKEPAQEPARIEALPTPAAPVADAVAPSLDAIPTAIPEVSDTVRDVAPFALHHTLGNAPAVATVVTPADESAIVTSVSMVDDPSLAAAVASAGEWRAATTATPDIFESVTSVGTNDEVIVFRATADATMVAAPVPMIEAAPAEVATDVAPAEHTPVEIATHGVPDELEPPSLEPPPLEPPPLETHPGYSWGTGDLPLDVAPAISYPMPLAPSPIAVEPFAVAAAPSPRRWRWVAAVATLVLLLGASAAVTVLVDAPSVSPQPQHSEPPKQESALKVVLMAVTSEPAQPAPPAATPPVPAVPPVVQPVAAQPPAPVEAAAAPARTAKAPATKVRPQQRPARRVVRKKCRGLECL